MMPPSRKVRLLLLFSEDEEGNSDAIFLAEAGEMALRSMKILTSFLEVPGPVVLSESWKAFATLFAIANASRGGTILRITLDWLTTSSSVDRLIMFADSIREMVAGLIRQGRGGVSQSHIQ